MKRRQLISSDDAVPVSGNLKKPCTDCPWARTALPGWTGSLTPEEWVAAAHGEARIECHVFEGSQCAGAAIYRANVVKTCRDPTVPRLPADRVAVFALPKEFIEHHEGSDRFDPEDFSYGEEL